MVYVYASTGRGMRRRGARGAEHWNWPEDSNVTVMCYTNCPEVSLMLNDQPIGRKQYSEAREGILTWEVPYAPGILKAVGLKNGQSVCEYVLQTAGAAERIELLPDVTQIRADGKDICHLEYRIVDDKGVLVPDAEQEVVFEVGGPGNIIGIGNGNLSDPEDYKDNKHKTYNGRGLAIFQSIRESGNVRITARAEGLKPASFEPVPF